MWEIYRRAVDHVPFGNSLVSTSKSYKTPRLIGDENHRNHDFTPNGSNRSLHKTVYIYITHGTGELMLILYDVILNTSTYSDESGIIQDYDMSRWWIMEWKSYQGYRLDVEWSIITIYFEGHDQFSMIHTYINGHSRIHFNGGT